MLTHLVQLTLLMQQIYHQIFYLRKTRQTVKNLNQNCQIRNKKVSKKIFLPKHVIITFSKNVTNNIKNLIHKKSSIYDKSNYSITTESNNVLSHQEDINKMNENNNRRSRKVTVFEVNSNESEPVEKIMQRKITKSDSVSNKIEIDLEPINMDNINESKIKYENKKSLIEQPLPMSEESKSSDTVNTILNI